jgi:hypothetical protein
MVVVLNIRGSRVYNFSLQPVIYTTDYRIFVVEPYIRKRTYAKCTERFIRKYSDSSVPTKPCKSKLIKKWWTTGSVLGKTRYHKKIMLTDEKLEDILARLQVSPRESPRRLTQETIVSIGCTTKAAKLIKFRSYRVGVVQEFKHTDAPQRIRFCNWMKKNAYNGLVDAQLLFIPDEAYFHLTAYVNSQNTRI